VDRSSIELFANDGEVAITDLIFPLTESDGIELYAKGGNVWLRSLLLFPLKSVYAASVSETVNQ
jgi:fructan beta-fructosidase